MANATALGTCARINRPQTTGQRVNQPNRASDLIGLMRLVELTLLNYRDRITRQEATIQKQAERISLLEKQASGGAKSSINDERLRAQELSRGNASISSRKCAQADEKLITALGARRLPGLSLDSDRVSMQINRSFDSEVRNPKQGMRPSLGGKVIRAGLTCESDGLSSDKEQNPSYSSSLHRVSLSPEAAMFRFWFWPKSESDS